jgi:hypothetical protein
MTRVTVDTNVFPIEEIERLSADRDVELFRVTVADRELEGTSITMPSTVSQTAESFVIGESRIGEGAIASEVGPLIFEQVLEVISSGSFPKQGNRRAAKATEGRNDLRQPRGEQTRYLRY